MRNLWTIILIVGLLFLTSAFVFAQQAVPNLSNSSWVWLEKEMSVKYFFGPANEAAAKIILTGKNYGFQISRADCHFYVPFTYQVKGDLLYANLPGRKEAQVSQISSVPEQKLQTQEVAYFVKTYSELSGEHEEIVTRSPQILERVNN